MHERCGFGALHAACAESGEKFPLLAARLACATLQRQEEGHQRADTAPASRTMCCGGIQVGCVGSCSRAPLPFLLLFCSFSTEH